MIEVTRKLRALFAAWTSQKSNRAPNLWIYSFVSALEPQILEFTAYSVQGEDHIRESAA